MTSARAPGTVVGLVALAGDRLRGRRLAGPAGAPAAFMAATGDREKTMTSVYPCGVPVRIAAAIGMPSGVAAARDDRVRRIVRLIIDTPQPPPSFVYLVAAVTVFRVGEFWAMIAVVACAVAPAVPCTDHGIRRVPADLVEAGRGVVAGLCGAFVAITADRLINAWARRGKRELGLAT